MDTNATTIRVSRELYDAALAVVRDFARVYDQVWDTPSVNPGASCIKWCNGLGPKTMKNVNSVYLHDLFLCMSRMECAFSMSNAESIAVFLCINHVLDPDFLATLTFQNIEYRMQTIGVEQAELANFKPGTLYFEGADEYEFSIVALLMQCNEQALAGAYVEVMHSLCSFMLEVHGTASQQAIEWHAATLDDWTRKPVPRFNLQHEYHYDNTKPLFGPKGLVGTDKCQIVSKEKLS